MSNELEKFLRPKGVELLRSWDGKNEKVKNLIISWSNGKGSVNRVRQLLAQYKENGSFFADEVKPEPKTEKKVVDNVAETKKEEPVIVPETVVEEPKAEPVEAELKEAETVVEEGVGQEPEPTTEEPQVEAEPAAKKTTRKKKVEE